jgi:carbon storage regulator
MLSHAFDDFIFRRESALLILSRKLNEKILIGDGIVVTVLDLRGGKVKLGFSAPEGVKILREELKEKKDVE